jgi:hypothetical protein
MGMLVRIMNWLPSLAGLAVTIVMIPMSAVVGKILAKARRDLIKSTDARVKAATEIITGEGMWLPELMLPVRPAPAAAA